MRTTLRASSRALLTTATAGALLSLTLATGAGTASAHVHVDADDPAPGSTAILTFRVPGESENGTLTNQFSVALPDVASARAEVIPGWTSRLDRNAAAGTVRSVTWTAAPGTGISADQFALFRISVTLPDTKSVNLPATQTYSDGQAVRWDEPPLPDGGEPEHPVPMLELSGTPTAPDAHHGASMAAAAPDGAAADTRAAAPDDTARWLAGGALILAAVALVVTIVRRRPA